MSSIAGRVGIVPKGDFSSSVQYDKLDTVKNGNAMFLAKAKPPVGTETSDTDYWMKMMEVEDLISSICVNNKTSSEIQNLIDNAPDILIISGTVTISEPLRFRKQITVIFKDCCIHQSVWGNPCIIISSNNINFFGSLELINDVEARTQITSGYYNLEDAKANSSGIMLYNEGTYCEYENLYIECVKIKNFIGGICNLTNKFSNINIDYIYVENVDFGVFGAHFINMYIRHIEFKNIASYIGSDDPSHAVYLTGGSDIGLSKDVTIQSITGYGCISKNTDSVISVKSCTNVFIESADVQHIAQFCVALTSVGYVKNAVIDDVEHFANCQLSNTNFLLKDCMCTNMHINSQIISNTAGSEMHIENCKFYISDMTDNVTRLVYASNGKYYERECVYIPSSVNENVACYYWNGDDNDVIEFYDPTIKNIKLWDGGSIVGTRVGYITPSKLDYPRTNQLFGKRLFLPDTYICDEVESANYPNAFRTNNVVRVTDASIANFNTYNATTGTVYTLINGGGVYIQNNDRIKTKSGAEYGPSDWTVFRFMNIGNVAYEV